MDCTGNFPVLTTSLKRPQQSCVKCFADWYKAPELMQSAVGCVLGSIILPLPSFPPLPDFSEVPGSTSVLLSYSQAAGNRRLFFQALAVLTV